jgi:hypothetical protein
MEKKIDVNGYSVDRYIVDESHLFLKNSLYDDYVKKMDAKTVDWMEAALMNYTSTGSRGPAMTEPKGSKIVVDFNRRLTAAEKFDLRRLFDHVRVKTEIYTTPFAETENAIPDYDTHFTSVVVTTPDWDDPVELLETIADVVENNFLNVYPRSVHTIYPRLDK